MSLIIIIQQWIRQGAIRIAAGALGVPRNLRFTGRSQQHLNQIQLAWAWDEPAEFGADATGIARYEYQFQAVGGSWSNTFHTTARAVQIAVSESATTSYRLRVRAVNNAPTPQTSGWVVSAPQRASIAPPPQQQGREMAFSSRTQQWGGIPQRWGT